MSQRKISIIMPAYNVEKTIKKAAYSCVNQSLKDIELIIVDDCSTDSTRDLMVEIKNEYPDKVKILFQEKNSRQGAARNKGYKEAEGKYILFVDSDDWIDIKMYQRLYKKIIEEKADICSCDYYEINSETGYINRVESLRTAIFHLNEFIPSGAPASTAASNTIFAASIVHFLALG